MVLGVDLPCKREKSSTCDVYPILVQGHPVRLDHRADRRYSIPGLQNMVRQTLHTFPPWFNIHMQQVSEVHNICM